MKVIFALFFLGAAFAAPDGGLRQVVNYGNAGSTVSILRGADLRGDDSGERVRIVQQPAQRIQYVSAPRTTYRRVEVRPQVVYQQPAAQTIVVRQPAPQPIVYRQEPARVTYQQPAVQTVRYRDDSVEYRDDDAKYQFAYEVRDDYGVYHTRQEARDGNRLEGVYTVLDPDGYLRTVKYEDKGYGFVAAVTRTPAGGNSYAPRTAYGSGGVIVSRGGSDSREN